MLFAPLSLFLIKSHWSGGNVLAAKHSSKVSAVPVPTLAQSLRKLPDPDLESMTYELQQAYRILRELFSDSNKSFVGPFMHPVDASAPGCADYYERIDKPICMKQSTSFFILFSI